ncbi:MAG TPA: hypothetical protein VNS79_13140 [Sphingobium sp.]|nr:hypothetical protein [Sphingobium sp.]
MHIGSWAKVGFLVAAIAGASVSALAEDPPETQAERRALNEAQAKFAAQQIADYQAQKAAIAEEQAAKEAAYRDAVAARDADIAATRQKAADDHARWEAAVAACNAGDVSQCAQPQQP